MMKSLFKSAAALLVVLALVVFTGCEDDTEVIGLNESTKFGYIKLTFDGTRPDGVAFNVTKNYRFITGAGPASSSTVTITEDGSTYYQFRATRLFDPFDNSPRSANLTINAVEENGEIVITSAQISATSSLYFKDQTAFNLAFSGAHIEPEDFTTFSYNEDNGKTTVKFETVVPEEYGNTGYDLTVSGTMKVTLYKPITGSN